MSGAAGDPRWLDLASDDDRPVPTLSRARTGRANRPVAIVAGLLLAGVLAAVGLTRDDGRSASRDLAEPAATQRPASPAPTTAETDDPPVALADGLERLDAVFRMVLRPEDGMGSMLLTIDPDTGSSVAALPDLSRYEFDSAGEWLAGLSVTRWGDRRRVLWVGPTDRSMEPLGFHILAFAWHDARPGMIAFSTADRNTVSIADLTRNEPAEVVTLPVEGVVRGWGEWGFAIETSPRAVTTAIVGPDGSVLASGLPGRFRSVRADGRIVLSGRRHMLPFAVDPATGRISDTERIEPSNSIWRLADAQGADRALAMVYRSGLGGRKFDGSLYSIGADGLLDHAGEVYGYIADEVGDDGSIVILSHRADGQDQAAINAVIGDELAVLPLPSDGWIATISAP